MLRAAASCAAILVVASACGWPVDSADSVRRAQQAALHAIAARVHLQGGAFERAEQSLRRCADLSHSPVGTAPLARFYVDRGRPEAR